MSVARERAKGSGTAGLGQREAGGLCIWRILLLGLIVLGPLVFWNTLSDAYDLPKQVLIDAGVALVLVALGWRRGSGVATVELPRSIVWLLAAGLAWCWLSAAWSLNRYGSLVQASHWTMCALAMIPFARLFASLEGKTVFLATVSWSAVLVAAVSMLHHAGLLAGVAVNGSLHPLFGEPNNSAQLLLYGLPAILWWILYGGRRRVVLWAAAGLALVCAYLFHLQAEASWLALVVQLGLFAGGVVMFRRRGLRPAIPARLAGAAAAVFLVCFLVLASVGPDGFRWRGAKAGKGLHGKWLDVADLVVPDKKAGSGAAARSSTLVWRLSCYRSSLEMARRQPLTGVGLFNFEVYHPAVAVELGVPTMVTLDAHCETVHNDFLQVLTELGIPGALAGVALLGMMAGAVVRLFRCGKASGPPSSDGTFGLVAACALAGHLTDAIFDYPTFRTMPPFLGAGFLVMLLGAGGMSGPLVRVGKRGLRVIAVPLAGLTLVFGAMRIGGAYHFGEQRRLGKEGNIQAALACGEKARWWNPFFPYNNLLTGIQLMVAGRLEESRPLLEQHFGIFPNKPSSLYYLAIHRIRSGDLAGAAKLTARARAIAPADEQIRLLEITIAQLRATGVPRTPAGVPRRPTQPSGSR